MDSLYKNCFKEIRDEFYCNSSVVYSEEELDNVSGLGFTSV